MEKKIFTNEFKESEAVYSRNNFIKDTLEWNLRVPQAGYGIAPAILKGYLEYKLSHDSIPHSISAVTDLNLTQEEADTVLEYMHRAHAKHSVRVVSENNIPDKETNKASAIITSENIKNLYSKFNEAINNELYTIISNYASDETILSIITNFIENLGTKNEILNERKKLIKEYMVIRNDARDNLVDHRNECDDIKSNIQEIDRNIIYQCLGAPSAEDVKGTVPKKILDFLLEHGLTQLSY